MVQVGLLALRLTLVVGGSRSPSPNGKMERQGQKERYSITCYGCGEQGHIRPNCPNKIRRIKAIECDSDNSMETVDGWLAGSAVPGLRIDTGSGRTIVSAEFVPESAYLQKSVILDSWRGKQFSKHRVARMSIKVGETEVVAEVAVSEKLEFPALLGVDLGNAMKMQLMGIVLERVRKALSGQKEKKEDSENMLASAESEAQPVPLADIFDFPDSYFDEDPLPVPVEESSTLPEVCEVNAPLPTMVLDGSCENADVVVEIPLPDVVVEIPLPDVVVEIPLPDVVVETPLPELMDVGAEGRELVIEPLVVEPVVQVLSSDQKKEKGVCRVLQVAVHPVAPIMATGYSTPARVVESVFVFHDIVYLYDLLEFYCSWLVAGEQFSLQLAVLGVTSGEVLRWLKMDPVQPAVGYIRVDTGLVFCFLWRRFFLDWWRRRFKTFHQWLILRKTVQMFPRSWNKRRKKGEMLGGIPLNIQELINLFH